MLIQAIMKLKNGIESGNQAMIEDAYLQLSGESAKFPSEAIEAKAPVIFSESPKLLTVEKGEDLDFRINKPKAKSRPAVAKRENRFKPDDTFEMPANYDKIDDNVKPSPRTREPFVETEVFCQDCQKTLKVHPSFAKNPYYCDFIKLGKPCPIVKGN